jgi:Zn-dependent protease with chaperone function
VLAELLLIGSTVAAVVLLAAALGSLLLHRAKRAAAFGAGLVALVVAYTAALLGVSLASTSRTLGIGQWKCFGEWCVTVTASRAGPTEDTRVLELDVRNRGHRVERPSAPRAYLIVHGRTTPIAVPELGAAMAGGGWGKLTVTVRLPASYGRARLLVTEGAFPSQFCLDDENSPLHARDAWQV